MLDRNLLLAVRRLALTGAGLTLIGLSSLAAAEELPAAPNAVFPLLSLLSPAVATPGEVAPGEALTTQELKAAPQLRRTIDLTSEQDSLWSRLRNGFAMNNLGDDLTLHYQQWYQNRPDALRRMVDRARPYLHHIVEELEARGMPTELALLPMVESSFNPMAYSRAHASGLWQFIPATGKRFNLEQSWWQDQRRDVLASTGAALDYLQTIYEMHGDWHLALASYNWGEGAVKKAIEKNQARGLPTDYASLNMPPETRHYVPKLQALKNIFGNPALLAQLGVPEIANRAYFATLEAPRAMDIKTAARLAGMSTEEFVRLNPAHNRPVIKPETPLVIPADKLDTFRSNLENNQAPLSEWQAYTLKSGERLDQIANRFGIRLSDLQQVNSLPGKIRLGAGSTLLVPAGEGSEDVSRYMKAPALPQIVEPEPVVRQAKGGKTGKGSDKFASRELTSRDGGKGKGGKALQAVRQESGGKAAKQLAAAAGKSSGKTAGMQARNDSRAATAKAAPAPKQASGKSPAPAKVAKSGNGRRG